MTECVPADHLARNPRPQESRADEDSCADTADEELIVGDQALFQMLCADAKWVWAYFDRVRSVPIDVELVDRSTALSMGFHAMLPIGSSI